MNRRTIKTASTFALLFLIPFALSLFLDAVTKAIAVNTIHKYMANYGVAFSLGSNSDSAYIFAIINAVVLLCTVCGAIYVCRKFTEKRNAYSKVAIVFLGILAGGTCGNFIDRLINPPYNFSGYVVDFINYFGMFTGNVADIEIVVSVFVLIFIYIKVVFGKN